MLKIEDFWDIYDESGFTAELMQESIELLKQPLSEDVEESRMLSEILFELVLKLYELRDYEKIEMLLNPEFAQNVNVNNQFFISKCLIEQRLYLDSKSNIQPFLKVIWENPEDNYDDTLEVFRLLLFYQRFDITDEICEHLYEVIKNSNKYFSGSEVELLASKMSMLFVENYLKCKATNNIEFDTEGWQRLVKYDVSLDYLRKSMQIALKQTVLQEKITYTHKDVLYHFLVWGYEHGIPAYHCEKTYYYIAEYTNSKFTRALEANEFIKFCHDKDGFFGPTKYSVFIAFLSAYFYEFLYDKQLITDMSKYIPALKKAREHFAKGRDFWQNSYLFHLPKPQTVSQEEWDFYTKRAEETFSEVIESESIKDETDNLLKGISELPFVDMSIKPKPRTQPQIQTISLPKIDRNKIVKVVYEDGTEKEGKFKKLENDLEKGLCKLI